MSRVCGDDPPRSHCCGCPCKFVPRMRGWSCFTISLPRTVLICPAYAGMIPGIMTVNPSTNNLSRVCGDDPNRAISVASIIPFVPRMRGWSFGSWPWQFRFMICPAYAGMILPFLCTCKVNQNLSRVCGDDPLVQSHITFAFRFVPRMRGWSCVCARKSTPKNICPAYAGMILGRALSPYWERYLSRVCGDDPLSIFCIYKESKFVPRMRGWSYTR